MKKMYVVFPYERVQKKASVYIYGAGKVGQMLAWQVKRNNYCELLGFIDAKVSGQILGSDVQSVDIALKREFDYIVIGILDDRGIADDLVGRGIDREKIICLSKENIYEEDEVDEFPEIISNNQWLPEHLRYKKGGEKQCLKDIISAELINKKNSSVIKENTLIGEALIISIKRKIDKFYVCANSGKYIGSIDFGSEDIADLLDVSMAAQKYAKVEEEKTIYIEETVESVAKKIYKLVDKEFPVVNRDKQLICMMDKMDFYAAICDVKNDEKNLVISRAYCKDEESFPLWKQYMYNINSQNGEDGIIEEILKRIGIESRYCVEFGAWDGEHLSNTKLLIDKYGFRALFIEGDPKRAQDGIENYKDKKEKVHYAVGYVQHRNGKTLEDFLTDDSAPVNIDVMSIDIDGYDYHVWDSLKNYRPRVVCIEYNPSMSNDIVVIPPLTEDRLVGASPLALVELGHKKGYSLAAVTRCNLLFVVDEEFDKLGLPYNDLALLRDYSAVDTCFSAFEGRVYCTGKIENYFWDNNMQLEEKEFNVSRK